MGSLGGGLIGVSISPVFTKFELPRPISQEASMDPRWDGPLDSGTNRLRGLLHSAHKGLDTLQAFDIGSGFLSCNINGAHLK